MLNRLYHRFERAAQSLGNVLALLTLSFSFWLVFHVSAVSPHAVHALELSGATLALLMWLAASSKLIATWRDMWWVQHMADPDLNRVAKREFIKSVYGWVGKTFLGLALVFLELSRFATVLTWLRVHPLSIFMLVLDAMALFTILDLVDPLWRGAFTMKRERDPEKDG